MAEFFRGWKRKVGVVTLVLACLLTAAWIRSSVIYDSVYGIGSVPEYRIGSMFGLVCIFVVRSEDTSPDACSDPHWISGKASDLFNPATQERFDPMQHSTPNWRRDFAGFHFGEGRSNLQMSSQETWRCCSLPYWSIVLPFTLISVWLLLSGQTKPNLQDGA